MQKSLEKHAVPQLRLQEILEVLFRINLRGKFTWPTITWRLFWKSMIIKSLQALHWQKSLHQRNISHFGPTTQICSRLRDAQALCPSIRWEHSWWDYETGTLPREGAVEAGDNNTLAVNRAPSSISFWLTKSQLKEGKLSWGLPINAVQWDIYL